MPTIATTNTPDVAGEERSVFVSGFGGTANRVDPLAIGRASGAAVEDLLRKRAELPLGHPDQATLRTQSIEAALPLVRRVANRYRGRGEPLDDLYQVAALALVRAVDAFDPARQVAFSAYAVPCIVGAIKHHFRDTTWRLRIPRAVHDLAIRIGPADAHLSQQLGRTPTVRDLATFLHATEAQVVTARDAWRAHHPYSLDALTAADGADARTLHDTIGGVDAHLDLVLDRHALHSLLATLPNRERRILDLRFYQGMTQSEIAGKLELSQMHISRLLTRTLTRLRGNLHTQQPGHTAHPTAKPSTLHAA